MAKQVITTLVDDIDGGEASETITFGVDGTEYEIDLNEKRAAKFRKDINLYVENGRKIRSAKPARNGRKVVESSGPTPKEVRAWAIEQGFEISERGRISEELVQAYTAAH